MPRVLIVDDEQPLRDSLTWAFSREGFTVSTADDGPSALRMAQEFPPDLVVLDRMLPGLDGMDVCRRLREQSEVPIVMLTARDQAVDKVDGLESGADDYVTKPFNTRELIARARAAVRRRQRAESLLAEDRDIVERLGGILGDVEARRPLTPPTGDDASRVTAAGLTLDPVARLVFAQGREIPLGGVETRVLQELMRSVGRVVTRTELATLLEPREGEDSALIVRAVIRSLRSKLGDDPLTPGLLLTVPGIGYQLRP